MKSRGWEQSDLCCAGTLRGLLLGKVPEATIYFWLIEILSTTVGETAADFLSTNMGLGEGTTALVMSGLLIIALIVQFRAPRYVAGIYWITVVLIGIVGTLITDNLSDTYNVALDATTASFATALVLTFTPPSAICSRRSSTSATGWHWACSPRRSR